MERCFGFVSSVMMMMMMGHDENDNIYSTLYDLYVCTCT